MNFKSTEQSEKTSKFNIAALHKWPFCLVAELKISMYFIGEIEKHASFGGGSLCALLSSGHPQKTPKSSWAPFSGTEGSVLLGKQASSVPIEKLLDDIARCYNVLATHELQCLSTANVFFSSIFSIGQCCFACSISMHIKLHASMEIFDHCNIAFLVMLALCGQREYNLFLLKHRILSKSTLLKGGKRSTSLLLHITCNVNV